MSLRRAKGVPPVEHPASVASIDTLDWQLLRLFLELHRAGSFRAAAERLDMSINSLRRRLEDLEKLFGVPLFTRHFDGLRPTNEAERLIGGVRAMEDAAFGLLRARHAWSSTVEGEVKVAVTEGLGSIWLTPRIAELQTHHPQLRIDLTCGANSADVLRMEADLSVQLTRPQAPDLKLVRLGYLHSMPFASNAYVAQHGLPKTLDELGDHRLVLQLAEQASQLSLFRKIAPTMARIPTVAFTTNVSSAHALAIANGIGIGWLPTYVSSLHSGLVPVNCGVEFDFDIWLTYHPDVETIPRVRRTIDWLRACFDPRAFPFFSEQRIHPRDLPLMDRFMPLTEWYRGFVP